VSYDYDPQNLRRAKTVNGTTTNYLSIGNQAVGDQGKGQEIAEYDGSGNLLRRYVYGLGLDEPLATIDAAGNHSYHFSDGLGSVVALANASGQLTEKHAYSAYGLASSTTGTAFQFAGRRVDPETGLYYNRARYYSPSLGRFLQTDPTGTKGGINLYAYTANDPVNRIDPTGRAPTWMSASGVNAYGQMNTGALSAANDNAFNPGPEEEADEVAIPQFIYRTGSQTDNALTDSSGVSFRSSVSSSADNGQVFQPGSKLYSVDTSLLPDGSVVPDDDPAGHVSVYASPDGSDNPLNDFGLKALDDGSSYRLSKN
jgi:RHS repeat-associated protein